MPREHRTIRDRLSKPRSARPTLRARVARLRDPVVGILLLAGFFDGISGNPIHGIVLGAVGLALAWDVAGAHVATVPRIAVQPHRVEGRTTAAILLAAAMFSAVIGGFARFSWPATLPVVAVASAGLVLAWRGPWPGTVPPPTAEIAPVGVAAWSSAFIALGLWELTQLLLQPSLTTDSYAHPTVSTLMELVLASHPGRSIVMFVWLGFGWFLMQR